MSTQEERLARARTALEGLSVGDAFGESYFVNPAVVEGLIDAHALRPAPWAWTDDTLMALSVYALLAEKGRIEQDALAADFARRYDASRGYGPAMHGLLDDIRRGDDWRAAARGLFDGQGSWGNGAAMRVAPLGAFFADDLDTAAEQAARSAEVTHAHPEAVAGAVAVAVAAAMAWDLRGQGPPPRAAFLDAVYCRLPRSIVAERVGHARDLDENASVRQAVAALGNGTGVSAQDTVPFALWCAAVHLTDYEEALWLAVSGLGDRDTTCAIAGGIVACYTDIQGIPAGWRESREPLPAWHVEERENG